MRFIRSLGSFLGPAFIGFGIIMFLGLPIALPLSPVKTQDKPEAAATTNPSKVKGLTLPQSVSVSATDFSKKITPIFDDPSKVLDVKWKVIGTGDKDPEFQVRGTGAGSFLVVNVPTDKDAILVICYALYGGEKPWVTDPASTLVEWQTGVPPPTTTPPTTTPPETIPVPPTTIPGTPVNVDQVFSSVKGIHAILVVDVQTANPELAALTQYKNGIQKIFEKPNTGNRYWQFDVKQTELQQQGVLKKLNDAGLIVINPQGKPNLKAPNPVVVLVDGSTQPAKMIGQPLQIQLTGNPGTTITQMLTAIANALKR